LKRWMDCVKDDMRIKRVSMEMTTVFLDASVDNCLFAGITTYLIK
jgi:hypothetical protein